MSVDRSPERLAWRPAAVVVTSTVTVHAILAPTAPKIRRIKVEPGMASTVPAQLLEAPFGLATTIPIGRVSVKSRQSMASLRFTVLSMENVSVLLAPNATGFGKKDLVKPGVAIPFVKSDLFAAHGPPSLTCWSGIDFGAAYTLIGRVIAKPIG